MPSQQGRIGIAGGFVVPQVVTFGTVFMHGEKEYVFLVKTEDTIYAAEILDREFSTGFKTLRNSAVKNSKNSYKLSQNFAYCFVELRTKGYGERVAHYGYPQMGDIPNLLINIIGTLNEEDIKELYRELIDDELIVSAELKELVKALDVKLG